MNVVHFSNNLSTAPTLEAAVSLTGRSKSEFARRAELPPSAFGRYLREYGPYIKAGSLSRMLRNNGIDFRLSIGDQMKLENHFSGQTALKCAQDFLKKPQAHMGINGINVRTLRRIMSGENDTTVENLTEVFFANNVPFAFTMKFYPLKHKPDQVMSSASPPHPELL